MKDPYRIVKKRYSTEKATVLENLKDSIARCKEPKFIFIVDLKATKPEIAQAVQYIYKEKNVQVTAVNTIIVKPKKRNKRGRMNPGITQGFKKAIVTLAEGNSID